ncbi:hypothetical protein B0T14DRAFT_176176 [Immersiella caudata]|uniref:Uncharacterized protein n=1 Tax=Immersiella caudata TaxID=314043 RepID=A0AA39WXE8_9PEZI|nr:hypothetical protein B0T14DRAFT_176176 [Immersiella caudata]
MVRFIVVPHARPAGQRDQLTGFALGSGVWHRSWIIALLTEGASSSFAGDNDALVMSAPAFPTRLHPAARKGTDLRADIRCTRRGGRFVMPPRLRSMAGLFPEFRFCRCKPDLISERQPMPTSIAAFAATASYLPASGPLSRCNSKTKQTYRTPSARQRGR